MAVTLSGDAGRQAGGFLDWWAGELAAMLPGQGRRLPVDGFVVALFDGRMLQFAARLRQRVEDYGVVDLPTADREPDSNAELLAARIRRSGLPLVLRLAPELGLHTADRLPAAAKGDLRAIIANRLDILTPWSAEAALFDTVQAEAAADGTLAVEIAVAPRKVVDRALAAMARLGLVADFVDLGEDEPLAAPSHDLLHHSRPRRLPRWIPTGGALAVFAAVTIGAFAYFDIQARGATLAQRQAYAALLEQRLEDLPAIRARIDDLLAGGQAVAQRHLERPSALATLEALSRLLPDTVWLESLTLDGQQLALAGYSRDAAQLPALIEGNPGFEAARFAAPSERTLMPTGFGDVAEVDRFSLQIDVRVGIEAPN